MYDVIDDRFYKIPSNFKMHKDRDGYVTYFDRFNTEYELTGDGYSAELESITDDDNYRAVKLEEVSKDEVFKYANRKLSKLYDEMNALSGYRGFVVPGDKFDELEEQVKDIKRQTNYEYSAWVIDSLPYNCDFENIENTHYCKTVNIPQKAFDNLSWCIYPEEMIQIAHEYDRSQDSLSDKGFKHKVSVVFHILGKNVHPQYERDGIMICSGHGNDAIKQYYAELDTDREYPKGSNLDDFIKLIAETRYNHDVFYTVFADDREKFKFDVTNENLAGAAKETCNDNYVWYENPNIATKASGVDVELFKFNLERLLINTGYEVEADMIKQGKGEELSVYLNRLIENEDVIPFLPVEPLKEMPVVELDNEIENENENDANSNNNSKDDIEME